MSLVVTNEIDIESQRILDAPDNFSVLKLTPSSCTTRDVVTSYDEISSILRRREAIRNPKAAKARAKLDMAKAQLGTEAQLNVEKNKYHANFVSTAIPPEQAAILNIILNTTEMLERRVEALRSRPATSVQ